MCVCDGAVHPALRRSRVPSLLDGGRQPSGSPRTPVKRSCLDKSSLSAKHQRCRGRPQQQRRVEAAQVRTRARAVRERALLEKTVSMCMREPHILLSHWVRGKGGGSSRFVHDSRHPAASSPCGVGERRAGVACGSEGSKGRPSHRSPSPPPPSPSPFLVDLRGRQLAPGFFLLCSRLYTYNCFRTRSVHWPNATFSLKQSEAHLSPAALWHTTPALYSLLQKILAMPSR